MPLARIRSFDPEAIAFLAAQLAQTGYTLQFVRPDETGLEEADLELTVVRRDLDQALQTASQEAERLGVDVTVVPGVIPEPATEAAEQPAVATSPALSNIPQPFMAAADIPEPAPFPSEIEMPAPVEARVAPQPIDHDFLQEKARWARIAKESSEKTAHVLGRGLGKAVGGLEVIGDSLGKGLSSGKENLADIGDATATHLNEWKVRFRTARALRREARQHERVSSAIGARNLRRPKPLWLRERIYKGAAIAAVLATAAIVGWTLAGYAGPANPVGKGNGIPAVQEQVPFGPASASAPALPAATPVSQKSNPRLKPTVSGHPSHTRAVTGSEDDQEVIVRHFDRKPASIQAKAKSHESRDGVKVISEE
ncbi:MAG TPA: hypothetical protein VFU86_18265 [Terriglobales bacterium]|nr:hypothetical protein [Terriglobales bacterium]